MANSTPSNSNSSSDSSSDEQTRVGEQIAARLSTRGVSVNASDSSDDLGSLLEAVEAFERAVEARGGDLMVDEAPAGKESQPDNADFVLPAREQNEPASDYIARIDSATGSLGQ